MSKQLTIVFFVRHFTERGTEVAVYDYAKYNELVLHNKSIIVCFTPEKQQSINFPTERYSYDKFKSRFPLIEIGGIEEMTKVIETHGVDFFYTLTAGGGGDIYRFEDKSIWGKCKTIKHCVFSTDYCEGDFYISIGEAINQKYGTHIPVIPHIVDKVECDGDLRKELNLPKDAIVLGRYGGKTEFNVHMTYQAIIRHLTHHNTNHIYFLFMNTNPFYYHPNIIYVEGSVDLEYKAKFVNSCDAMIHARQMGETFGMSVAEFSVRNKPVITCNCGDKEHIQILGDKAVVYDTEDQLVDIFRNIREIINSREDWNAYREYSPEKIMSRFHDLVFSKG